MSTLIREDKRTLRQRATRLYGYQTSSKALAKAQALHVGGKYVSDIEEDTLVWSGSQGVGVPVKSPRRGRRRSTRSLPPSSIETRSLSKIGLGSRKIKNKKINRGSSLTPRNAAIVQHYKGFVDSIRDGMAYLTLESQNGQRIELEWDARELAQKSIGERQPFVLNTMTVGDSMRCDFVGDRLQPLPEELRKDIDELVSHYRLTGDLDDDDD